MFGRYCLPTDILMIDWLPERSFCRLPRVQCPSREKQWQVAYVNPVTIGACPYSLLWVWVETFTTISPNTSHIPYLTLTNQNVLQIRVPVSYLRIHDWLITGEKFLYGCDRKVRLRDPSRDTALAPRNVSHSHLTNTVKMSPEKLIQSITNNYIDLKNYSKNYKPIRKTL